MMDNQFVEDVRACPKCGMDSRVIDCYTRKKDGRFIRRRECPYCYYRWNTIETVGKTEK